MNDKIKRLVNAGRWFFFVLGVLLMVYGCGTWLFAEATVTHDAGIQATRGFISFMAGMILFISYAPMNNVRRTYKRL